MFTVEDGTGLAGANSFASLAEFNTYLSQRLYATTAAAASDPTKQQALMMASQAIDASWYWNGIRKVKTQGLGWPRQFAVEVEFPFYGYGFWNAFGAGYRYYDSNSVPIKVKEATCEMAMELLSADRTTDVDGKGLKAVRVGPIRVEFDAANYRKMLPDLVRLLLKPFGRSLAARSKYRAVRRA